MIYCNLAGLMANKKVNISDVSKSTGISRTTLTGLYYNKFKGVQLDTANELCKFFNVNLDKLFMFCKYDISVESIDYTPTDIQESFEWQNSKDGSAVVSLSIVSGNVHRNCDICATLYFHFDVSSASIEIDLGFFEPNGDEEDQENDALLRKVFESLSDEFKTYVINMICDEIFSYYSEQLPPEVDWDMSVSTDF